MLTIGLIRKWRRQSSLLKVVVFLIGLQVLLSVQLLCPTYFDCHEPAQNSFASTFKKRSIKIISSDKNVSHPPLWESQSFDSKAILFPNLYTNQLSKPFDYEYLITRVETLVSDIKKKEPKPSSILSLANYIKRQITVPSATSKTTEDVDNFSFSEHDFHSYEMQTSDEINKTIQNNFDYVGHSFGLKTIKSGLKNYNFKNYNKYIIPNFTLKYDTNSYFTKFRGGFECFTEGTDFVKMNVAGNKSCICTPSYFSYDCGVPDFAWYSHFIKYKGKNIPKRRKVPRRVINGIPLNHEFAMFEARMQELFDVVDVFVLAESNYSAHGDPKPLRFLNKFKEGYMAFYQSKILHVFMGYFSKASRKSGWIADHYLRYFLGKHALNRIIGLEDDDLFILSDADELPKREAINFLRLYDDYGVPVGLSLRWTVFGFFWKSKTEENLLSWIIGINDKPTNINACVTIKYLRDVIKGNAFLIRKDKIWQHKDFKGRFKKYLKDGGQIGGWTMGKMPDLAGWHCSWCFTPKGIVVKMDAAQKDDEPRWGDYPHKKNLTYINNCIAKGRFFDDDQQFIPASPKEKDYAPHHFLEHHQEYEYLLKKPILMKEEVSLQTTHKDVKKQKLTSKTISTTSRRYSSKEPPFQNIQPKEDKLRIFNFLEWPKEKNFVNSDNLITNLRKNLMR